MRFHRLFPVALGFIALLLIPFRSSATSPTEWQALISFLEERFPTVYQEVGTVEEMHGDRIVFKPASDVETPERGRELIITSDSPHPVYLQATSSLIRVVSVFDGSVLARRIITPGKDPEKSDSVVIPSSPTIYLYTNVGAKNSWRPYQKLLEALLEANFEVVELNSPRIMEPPDRYGVLVRLEKTAEIMVSKVQSVYSGNTMYSLTRNAEEPVETVRSAGQIVQLLPSGEDKSQIASTSSKASVEKKQLYKARQIEPAEKQKYRLSDKDYARMVFCDLNGDKDEELALLGKDGVDLFQMEGERLVRVDQYLFDGSLVPIHLHTSDLDGDGGDELLISLVREVKHAGSLDNELSSLILTRENNRLFPLASGLPWYLRVIENRIGEKVALGQTQEPYDQYNGPIFRLKYDEAGVTVERGEIYDPAAEIYSIYQFNLHPEDGEKVIIIEPTTEVYGYYIPEEKVYAYSPRKYGPYRETAYPRKLAEKKYDRGGFEEQGAEMVFTARRFVLKNSFDGQCFLINKERRGETANIVDKGIERLFDGNGEGKDSIVGLTWGLEGLTETWESKPLPRDIIDFGFKGNTGYLLTRDNRGGYAIETLH